MIALPFYILISSVTNLNSRAQFKIGCSLMPPGDSVANVTRFSCYTLSIHYLFAVSDLVPMSGRIHIRVTQSPIWWRMTLRYSTVSGLLSAPLCNKVKADNYH